MNATSRTGSFAVQIEQAAGELGLQLPTGAAQRLDAYIHLLDKWNRVYNLTAVRKPAAMVTRHILDCLAIAPLVTEGRLLDVGTGAGLPGIPLALARPGLDVVMVDSSAKKLRFVDQALAELGLENARTVHARIEALETPEAFDFITSRAFSSLDALYAAAHHLLAGGGKIIAMKGALPEAEIDALRGQPVSVGVERLEVPDLDAERHAIVLMSATAAGSD